MISVVFCEYFLKYLRLVDFFRVEFFFGVSCVGYLFFRVVNVFLFSGCVDFLCFVYWFSFSYY